MLLLGAVWQGGAAGQSASFTPPTAGAFAEGGGRLCSTPDSRDFLAGNPLYLNAGFGVRKNTGSLGALNILVRESRNREQPVTTATVDLYYSSIYLAGSQTGSATGEYEFPLLEPGPYEVEVGAPGFRGEAFSTAVIAGRADSVWVYLASLPLREIAQTLQAAFSSADLDGNGGLDIAEARRILEWLAQEDFAALDASGDGRVSREELQAILNPFHEAADPGEAAAILLRIFDAVDLDGDGSISFSEVLAQFPDFSENLFLECDVDRDGFLTREELESLLEEDRRCGCNRLKRWRHWASPGDLLLLFMAILVPAGLRNSAGRHEH